METTNHEVNESGVTEQMITDIFVGAKVFRKYAAAVRYVAGMKKLCVVEFDAGVYAVLSIRQGNRAESDGLGVVLNEW